MQPPTAPQRERPEISVWLDNSKPTELKRYHCQVCGKIVFEYFSDAKIVMPGEMGEAKKSPIIIQCKNTITVIKNGFPVNTHCNAKYWVE